MSIRGLNTSRGPSDVTSALFNADGSARRFIESPPAAAAFEAACTRLVEQRELREAATAPSSYPDPRHLVGFSETEHVPDEVFTGVLSACAEGVYTPISAGRFGRELPLPDAALNVSDDEHELERVRWTTAQTLREMLADHDERLCADCGGEGRVMQHDLSDRQRLTPYRCQTRSICPCCGLAYGQQRGLELVELLTALLQPGRLLLRTPEVSAWHLVLSCDRRVSEYITQLVDADDRDQLRRVIATATEDVHAAVERVYGAGTACVVAWHWWHSDNPLSSTCHLHAHVTVPNVQVLHIDGRWSPTYAPLRERGMLAEHELEELRLTFGELLTRRRWCRPLVRPPVRGLDRGERQPRDCWQPNVHARFSQAADGKSGYRHRMRYDARVSAADVLQLVMPELEARHVREQLYGEHATGQVLDQPLTDIAEMGADWEAVSRWIHRAGVMQSIQSIRYTGWLTNAARRELGLTRDKTPAEKQWCPIGVYRVLAVREHHVLVERWNSEGRRAEAWHRDHVQLMPPPSRARGWQWSDDVRPLRQPGPPAAWLAKMGDSSMWDGV